MTLTPARLHGPAASRYAHSRRSRQCISGLVRTPVDVRDAIAPQDQGCQALQAVTLTSQCITVSLRAQFKHPDDSIDLNSAITAQ